MRMVKIDENILHNISSYALQDERESVANLHSEIKQLQINWQKITKEAKLIIQSLREEKQSFSIEAFLQEYSLSTKEGIAIMCLAEALLRIPDKATIDNIIKSTFKDTDWEKHIGKSESLLVNASSWGLLLTGKTINYTADETNINKLIGKIVKGSSEPIIRQALKSAMHIIASQFVMGEDVESALEKAHVHEEQGYNFSYDMLGEGARSKQQADKYFLSYLNTIRMIGANNNQNKSLYSAPSVSIKLTALHPRYEWRKKERVISELIPKVNELIKEAMKYNIAIAIDAEESARLDIELEVFKSVFLAKEFAQYEGIGFVLQAYQKRAWHVLDFLIALSTTTHKKMPIRLVKGAYWDTEIKLAQMQGLSGYPVYTNKMHSDISYIACAKKILDNKECFYPQFATHNALTITTIIHMAKGKEYELQRLYGMGESLYNKIDNKVPRRIYAPIGEHRDLLAYLIRRLLENGANSSFVNIMMNKDIPIEEVLKSPLDTTIEAKILPLPSEIYANSRKNSIGPDIGNKYQMELLLSTFKRQVKKSVPKVKSYSEKKVNKAFKTACEAFNTWQYMPVTKRAILLENMAMLLEQNRDKIIALCVKEAGKTIVDAMAELRESIDFCHYYAAQSQNFLMLPIELESPTGEMNLLTYHPRGVFICISPWNFPLAIFLGQITAALVTGNCVLAKPAEQTPAIAELIIKLLHEAGIPKEVIQLVPGEGKTIGKVLVEDERTAGVCFTGSTETAKVIHQTLASRKGAIVPFIAETGGINCMIIDSSALIEQAVDDIIMSAFGSAGQRCSALRVLYVAEEIAEDLIGLLSGAVDELEIGSPENISTDIGPVIDSDAAAQLNKHITAMKDKIIKSSALSIKPYQGKPFIAPHIIEIDSIKEMKEEVFGPILHVIRYKNNKIDRVIDDINSTGYGLTCGVHSRIPSFYEKVSEQLNVGNKYINRNMIGAVVGVQPFGGEGKSGTGPKAGGPNYLLSFVTERVTTVNTAAIGGNIELLVEQ